MFIILSPFPLPYPVAGGHQTDELGEAAEEGADCQRDHCHEGKQASKHCQLHFQLPDRGGSLGTLSLLASAPLFCLMRVMAD